MVPGFSSPFVTHCQMQLVLPLLEIIFLYFQLLIMKNITLKNNQKLIGTSENWLCGTGSTIRSASGSTIIQGSITLAMNDTIKELILTIPAPYHFPVYWRNDRLEEVFSSKTMGHR